MTSLQLTPHQWANGYTLFAFKLTEGLIGSCVAGPRSHSNDKNFRLKLIFLKAMTANLKLNLIYQTHALLEIDMFNNVVMSEAAAAC